MLDLGNNHRLDLDLNRADMALAERVHEEFSRKEGSETIASRRAMEWLATCVRVFRPRTVLEMGAGIGTLTELILTHDIAVDRLVTTEDNEYCLSVLRGNLSRGDDPRLHLVVTPEELSRLRLQADLIVADGSFWLKAAATGTLGPFHEAEFEAAAVGTVIFVERFRRKWRKKLAEVVGAQGMAVAVRRCSGLRMPIRMRMSRRLVVPIPVIKRNYRDSAWLGIVNEPKD